MKKILLIASLLIGLYSFGQEVDVLIGGSSNSGFAVGIDVKNLAAPMGFYFVSHGTGTAFTNETNIDYSSICDKTNITDLGTEINFYGMSFGITYDLSELVKKENSGFTFYLGSGYLIEQKVTQQLEHYIWAEFPELNEDNMVTYISEEKNHIALEAMIGYSIVNDGMFKVGLIAGYNIKSGAIGLFSIGIGF